MGAWTPTGGAILAGDLPSGIDAAKVADGSVSSTEFEYLDGVTSDLQTQINAKAAAARSLTAGAGLTGGGDLSADRTFAVGAGTGITVNADDVALANTAVTPGSYTSASITVDQQGRLTAASSGSGAFGVYGDGSDGNVTISGGTTTLARDMVYDTLTISGTGVLKTAGYRVYCKTACIVQSGGVIHNDGNAASGSTQGATASTVTVGGSVQGQAGQVGVGGTPSGVTSSFGGAGGAGGAGSGGAGGGAGTVTAPAAANGTARTLPMAAMGCFVFGTGVGVWKGGGGGGGGGGNGSAAGGGGGGGGGVMLLAAKSITNSGAIRCLGGNGAAGTASNCGGGGGGGGGCIHLIYSTYSGTAADVSGGTKGASGGGSGVAGSDGSPGTVITLVH